jgi:16S rRNA (uracil1498-N3)-methyltransferase
VKPTPGRRIGLMHTRRRMKARLHVDLPLAPGLQAALPATAARHVQVLRLQPGSAITLFDGRGQDWPAEILSMGRSDVQVRVGTPLDVDRELLRPVTLAIGMPANERMDWLVEKACELGAAAIEPLVCERSVLRLDGERAARRRTRWQTVAIAAAEQCGRARVTEVAEPEAFGTWLARRTPAAAAGGALLLSLDPSALPLTDALRREPVAGASSLFLLSGPEGGLAPQEEAAARAAGFVPVGLGPRVLRAETAPLAALVLAAQAGDAHR